MIPKTWLLALLPLAFLVATFDYWPAQAADAPRDAEFEQVVKPFLKQNCVRCHNEEVSMAGIRVDSLDASLDERHIRVWEGAAHRISQSTMPPKGQPQPSEADRQKVAAWIAKSLDAARLRPAPKNGLVRRLTVAQYRNTLRELLQLDDDVAEALPPDAVSKDGFVNNKDTLQLSPLQLEAYLDIASLALDRAIVDPKVKPSIQDFRMDLGAGVNPAPLAEKLILGAGSALLENSDVLVTQLTPTKPFPFEPFRMRTKYRFIEGYRGNDTVRGWRDYDSIYHSVFADMRGSNGYPKGRAYDTVPGALLLRPAIPNEEMFDADGTYGPKANFKISLRELPDNGRFRVTVTAAKYNDGLLLDAGVAPRTGPGAIEWHDGGLTIPKAGLYQVDVYGPELKRRAADVSHLNEGLAGTWPSAEGKLEGKAHLIDSPVGKAVSLEDGADAFVLPRKALPVNDSQLVGEGDFTVAGWVQPIELKRAGLISLGSAERMHGWYLSSTERGGLRFETAGQTPESNAVVATRPGAIKIKTWQHVAVVVKRGRNDVRIYVNGYQAGRGTTGAAQFDDPGSDLRLGRMPGSQTFHGGLAGVKLYRRPLEEAEIMGLVEPGKQLVKAPTERPQDVVLTLGDRPFAGALKQPAFLAVRLEAGPLKVRAVGEFERIVFSPLAADQDVAKKFATFEKRSPRLGVHLGLRRDCGSTFAPVGPPQVVDKAGRYVFEGTLRNFPSPEVEKDNVNYLAGFHEIGVRSEYTDGRDIPRLMIKSVEFEGPFYEEWPPPAHKNIFVDFDHKSDVSAYARKIVHEFASKAYRRPVTAGEEASLMSVYAKSAASGRDFQDSLKDALLVVLTSPQFLFLVENSNTPAPEPLDSYELSSKLSYFLWNGPPDRRTLQLASSGALRGQLDNEVKRMISDVKFSRFIKEFTYQWLSLDKFAVLEPDRKRYPKMTRDTRTQLKQEPIEFLQFMMRNNLPVKNLISSDFVVANETVAAYYGLGDKVESGFQFVPLKHGRSELGGVLTQAAILAGLSDGRESNPVKRGAWLARKIIAEPPADPPPNVPALKESSEGLTLRQRIEQHRNQGACVQCHAKIDPWGIAFEEFDAGGRLKKEKADAKSTLPDKTEVAGANDLKRYLGEDRQDQVAFSFLKHLTTYATGRTLTYGELAYLKQDGLKLKASGYRMQDMIRYVVNSKMFLEK